MYVSPQSRNYPRFSTSRWMPMFACDYRSSEVRLLLHYPKRWARKRTEVRSSGLVHLAGEVGPGEPTLLQALVKKTMKAEQAGDSPTDPVTLDV